MTATNPTPPRRPVAEVVLGGGGTLEVVVQGVGQTIARSYSAIREALEPLRDGVTAAYDTDRIEVELVEGDDPIGRHGRQRLVGAQEFHTAVPATDSYGWDRGLKRDEEVVVTQSSDRRWVGVAVLRDYDGTPGSQVVHLSPEQVRWLGEVLRAHPGLEDQPHTNATAIEHDPLLQAGLDRGEGAPTPRQLAQAGMVAKVARLWEARDEYRLGQLVVDLLSRARPTTAPVPDLYYAEDTDLDRALDAAIADLR